MRQQTIEDRLAKLETLLDMSHPRPKIFEDIYNQMAEMRCDLKLTEATVGERVEIMTVTMDSAKDKVADCVKLCGFLESKVESAVI